MKSNGPEHRISRKVGGGPGLVKAVISGDTKLVKNKLERSIGKSDPNTTESSGGKSVLMIASQKYSETNDERFRDIFVILLNHGADITYITKSNETVFNYIDGALSDYLIQLIAYNQKLIIKILNLNVKLNDKFENFFTKLFQKNRLCVKSINPQINDLLYKILKNGQISKTNFETLYKSNLQWDKDIVTCFLDMAYININKGTVDVNEKFGNYLLLEIAILMGHVELVKLLIENVAIYEKDKANKLYMPGYYSDKYTERTSSAQKLLVDELLRKKDNSSILKLLSIEGLNMDNTCYILKTLIQEPEISINDVFEGYTLLKASIYNYCEDVTKILLEKGADYRIVDDGVGIINFLTPQFNKHKNYDDDKKTQYDNPMKEAVFRNMISKADYRFLAKINDKKLLNKYLTLTVESPNLDVNSVSWDYTLLELAVNSGSDSLVTELINKGANSSKITKIHRFFTDMFNSESKFMYTNLSAVILNMIENKDYRFLPEFSKMYIIDYQEYKYRDLIEIINYYIKILIDSPDIDLNMRVKGYSTLLGIAVTNNLQDRVEDLLEKDVDYNIPHNGKSIIEYVFESNLDTQDLVFRHMIEKSDYKFIPKIRGQDTEDGQEQLYYYLKTSVLSSKTREQLLELYKYIELLEDMYKRSFLRNTINEKISGTKGGRRRTQRSK